MAESVTQFPRGRRVGALTVLTDEDALNSATRDYFLKGLISPNEVSAIYGEPGCGKSFFALHLIRSIIQEREAFGRRVHTTNALFLALEGVSGFEKRLKAQIGTWGPTGNFSYIAQPVNLFSNPEAKNDVIRASQSCQAGIIIIDTLNRAMAEGSENDPADMGQFIQNLDALRGATGAHIMVIHHSGKDSARGMRGHSSLLGAVDLALEVKKDADGGPRSATVIKAKDDPDGSKLLFDLEVFELGDDEDGDKITTCIVREADIDDHTPNKSEKITLKPIERLWMEQLKVLFSRDGATQMLSPIARMVPVPCATRATVREWAKIRGLTNVAENVSKEGALTTSERSTINRTLNNLMEKKKLMIHGNFIWLL